MCLILGQKLTICNPFFYPCTLNMAALPTLIMGLPTILPIATVSYLINKCSICFLSSSPFVFCCSAFHWSHEKFLSANCTVTDPFFILLTVFWRVIPGLLMELLAAFILFPSVRQPLIFWGWPQHRNFMWFLTFV